MKPKGHQVGARLKTDSVKASQSDRTGAIFHLNGIVSLLHVCGPEAFQKQPLLNAFEAARAIQVRIPRNRHSTSPYCELKTVGRLCSAWKTAALPR
jgi:hypothetical protein